ncbi:MAG: Atxe2 family lasso peptide isopeptidase [Rhodanobacter sp.]
MAMKVLPILVLMIGFSYVVHAQTIDARNLLEVADFSGPVVSPNGKRVAFRVEQASVERNAYDAFWYVQDVDGVSPPHRVADGGVVLRDFVGDSLPATVAWSPDNRWIYYRALVDGKVDVWRAAADGSDAEPMTHDAADVRDFALDKRGRVLRYSVGATREEVRGAEQAEYDRGIHIDATVPIGQELFRSSYVGGRMATQRFSGKDWSDRYDPLLADVPDRWMKIDLAIGARPVREGSAVPAVPSLAPGKAGVDGDPWKSVRDSQGRVAWLTRVGDGKGQMYRPDVLLSALSDVHARRAIKCESELCARKAITETQWRPGHDEVLFTVTDPQLGLAQSILRWNVGTGEVRLVVKTKGLVNGGSSPASNCGVSSEAMVCVTAEADQPPRLERIDLENGDRHVLFDPNAALARNMAQVPVRLLRWQDKQRRWFTGQFYSARHSGDQPAPLFVTYYSCPGFVRGGVGDEWPLVTMAQAGISALCINRPPDYTMDAVARYGEGLAAVESVIDMLSKDGEVDRARVGMGGLSLGAEVTLWTAMKSNVLAAASVATPMASPLYYLMRSLKGKKAFLEGLRKMWGLGSPNETPERWKTLSPAFNLNSIRAPILMQVPEQEYMYGLDYEIPLIREHRADLYVFPSEPHQKFQPKHKLAVYERNLDWFRFWLQGYQDPRSSKSAQYVRWRVMRKPVRQGTTDP